ncbi:MAG TPA: hypothetical protein VL334_08080 [Anaerolineae bacterium]|nr:hypothetical protein [Anaerolineae bacterium]
MICQNTPQFDDVELLMTLDCEADPEVAMHVSQCPRCQQRSAELAGLQRAAAARLFRATCPSSLEVGEYHLGMLPASRSASVQQHVAACPYCAQELTQLGSFLNIADPYLHPAPWEAIKRNVQIIVARLTSGPRPGSLFGQPALAPALAGLRGEQRSPLTYEAGDAQIILEVQDGEQQAGRKTLIGLVLGWDNQEIVVRLWRDERLVSTVTVDTFGNFAIDDLAPGQYEMFVTSEPAEVHIQDLNI